MTPDENYAAAIAILKHIGESPPGVDVWITTDEMRILQPTYQGGWPCVGYYRGHKIFALPAAAPHEEPPPAAPPKTGRWRVGRSIPINVYDENDRPVCQCHTKEEAALIVEAMNFARAHFEGKR